jgi:hypothetical protein
MEDVELDVKSLDVDADVQPPTFSSSIPIKSTATSDISSRDDPFAPREGKALLWRGVNMTLVGRSLLAVLRASGTSLFVHCVLIDLCVSHLHHFLSLFHFACSAFWFVSCHPSP